MEASPKTTRTQAKVTARVKPRNPMREAAKVAPRNPMRGPAKVGHSNLTKGTTRVGHRSLIEGAILVGAGQDYVFYVAVLTISARNAQKQLGETEVGMGASPLHSFQAKIVLDASLDATCARWIREVT